MQVKQYEDKNFIIYAPNSLNQVVNYIINYTNNNLKNIFDFFSLNDFRRVIVNLFDNIDIFKNYISEIRKVDIATLPWYIKGTYDNGMINHYVDISKVKLSLILHELVHIIYKEIVLNNEYQKRVVWLDEGLAQNLSGENKVLENDEKFISFIDKILSIENLPALNELSHGKNFSNNLYNGYDLSYLAVRYLIETKNHDEVLNIIRSNEKSLQIGNTILEDAIKFYCIKYNIEKNKKSL